MMSSFLQLSSRFFVNDRVADHSGSTQANHKDAHNPGRNEQHTNTDHQRAKKNGVDRQNTKAQAQADDNDSKGNFDPLGRNQKQQAN